MVRRPVVASMLSLVGGVVVVLLVSTFALHSFLFLPGVISGIIVILSGVMLYERPNGHSLWSGLVIAVAVVDLLGVMFFLSAPAPQARSSDTNRVGGASTRSARRSRGVGLEAAADPVDGSKSQLKSSKTA